MITRLFHRKLVQIETCSTSFDLATFLNSLVTNKVSLGGPRKDTLGKSQNNLESNDKEASKIISAAFLSPQGRVLLDTMIYQDSKRLTEDGYLVEVDSSMVPVLQAHLKRYILRSPIQLSIRDDLQIFHEWKNLNNHVEREAWHQVNGFSFVDPRHSQMGSRKIVFGTLNELSMDSKEELIENHKYLAHRIHVGIGEGPNDFLYNSSLPLELNLDLANGVDFKKGCYLGQELTHRTKHLGVIRKRLSRLMVAPNLSVSACPPFLHDANQSAAHIIPSNTQIYLIKDRDKAKRKSIGRTGSWIGNIGLGVVKLDHVILNEREIVDIHDYRLETEQGIPLFAYSTTETKSS